jgi:methyl-galactoside transport system ATP-binding protein
MKEFGIDIDPRTKISDLSVSMRQMVEIVKAASWNAKVIVMDEPTSSLTEKETEKLFEIIARLKKSGCGIIFISHKIDEVLAISDSVTVMRDGQYVCTEPVENLNADKLVHYMVNRDLADRFPKNDARIGDVILKVEHLTTYYEPKVQDVSFEVHAGEILGIGGLVGARRTELMEALFGLRRIDTGTITFRDQRFVPKNSVNAMKHGLALVSEERRATGIIPMLSVEDNANISSLSRSTNRFGFISPAKMCENAQWVIDSMAVKTPSAKTPISNLSGGNQQKVIIGRCLLTEPEILLMDEPTRGIDVGAKYEIYQLMINIAKEGKAVIFISSEMPELLGVANRILVMSNGRVAGIEPASQLDQEKIFKLSAKYL